jgi:hypothetical protein
MLTDNAKRRAIYEKPVIVNIQDTFNLLIHREFLHKFGLKKMGAREANFIHFLFFQIKKLPGQYFDIATACWFSNKSLSEKFGFENPKEIEKVLANLSAKNVIVRKRAHGLRFIAFSEDVIKYIYIRSAKAFPQAEKNPIEKPIKKIDPPNEGGLVVDNKIDPPNEGGLLSKANPPMRGVANPPMWGVGSLDRRIEKEYKFPRNRKGINAELLDQFETRYGKIVKNPNPIHKGVNFVKIFEKYGRPYYRDKNGNEKYLNDTFFKAVNDDSESLCKVFGAELLIYAFEKLTAEYRHYDLVTIFERYSFFEIGLKAVAIAIDAVNDHNQIYE